MSDVVLSSVESKLEDLRKALVSIGTDTLRVDIETVLPSVDMARKDSFDRNPIPRPYFHYATLSASTPMTERWRYTVPSGKKAIHCVIFGLVNVVCSTLTAGAGWEISRDGGSTWTRYADLIHWSTTDKYSTVTNTVTFYIVAGDIIRGLSYNDDTVAHGVKVGALLLEFDA